MSYAQSLSSSSSTTLEDRHLANLIYILRGANHRYQQIAANVRQSITPTQRARLRARDLGLQLDIQLALQLDHRFVSTIPLPVISTSPPPTIATHFAAQPAQRSVPKIRIPAQGSDRRQAYTSNAVASSKWSPSPVTTVSSRPIVCHDRTRDTRRDVDVPIDIEDAEEEEVDDGSDDQSMYSVSTADDSCGLITPENMMPICNTRVKRKSSELYIVEKRAKCA